MFVCSSTLSVCSMVLSVAVLFSSREQNVLGEYSFNSLTVFVCGVCLGLLMLMVTVMRSWSAMAEGMTSVCRTRWGLLVIITSRRVAEVGVTRVGLSINWCILLFLVIWIILLLAESKLSLRSPSTKIDFLSREMHFRRLDI